MRARVRSSAAWACGCAMILACSGEHASGTQGGGGTGNPGSGGMPATTCSGNVVANEKNDYAFSSTVTFSPVDVAQMSNLTFDWSGLTRDFEGHELSPSQDLRMSIVMFWDLPLEQFEARLNADTLFTSDLIVSPPLSLELTGGATSARLYDYTINTTPVTPDMLSPYFDATAYPPSSASFLVGVQAGNVLGRDLRMLQAFNLNASSSTSVVHVTNDSMQLAYTANLHDLTVTSVPARDPQLTLNWAHMKTDALGHDFGGGYVTDAIVGHYSETPAELEAKFLDIDRIGLATYRGSILSGAVLDFTTLTGENGEAFPGIDETGTWLVGLLCGNCRNPAPLYMTVLKPCSP